MAYLVLFYWRKPSVELYGQTDHSPYTPVRYLRISPSYRRPVQCRKLCKIRVTFDIASLRHPWRARPCCSENLDENAGVVVELSRFLSLRKVTNLESISASVSFQFKPVELDGRERSAKSFLRCINPKAWSGWGSDALEEEEERLRPPLLPVLVKRKRGVSDERRNNSEELFTSWRLTDELSQTDDGHQ